MLSPVEIATLIAFCTPWAEPSLAYALVIAGSGGEPYRIAQSSGQVDDHANRPAAERALTSLLAAKQGSTADSILFVGLMQVPIPASSAHLNEGRMLLDKCTNLATGIQRYALAWETALRTDPSPWPRSAVAFNLFRSAQALRQTDYSTKATEVLKSGQIPRPAPPTDPIYHAVAADWSASIAQRHGYRVGAADVTLLDDAAATAQWARSRF